MNDDIRCRNCRRQIVPAKYTAHGWTHARVEGLPRQEACRLDIATLTPQLGSTFAEPVADPRATIAWVLIGGPCVGTYEAQSPWPPPERIRAVHGGESPAVLDLPGDEPNELELVVEYERVSYGFVCRGLGGMAAYFPAGWTNERRIRVARAAASKLEAVAA